MASAVTSFTGLTLVSLRAAELLELLGKWHELSVRTAQRSQAGVGVWKRKRKALQDGVSPPPSSPGGGRRGQRWVILGHATAAGGSLRPLSRERRQNRADTREPVYAGHVYSHR